MRKVIASELVSLDGVVRSPQNWHFNDQMAEAIGAAMAASDAMLLGRVTYEEFAAFGLPRRLVTKIVRPTT